MNTIKNPEKQENNSKKRYLVVVVVVCEDMAAKDKVCWGEQRMRL
jgi:hypothetical protein